MIRMIVAFCNQTSLRREEYQEAPPRVARIFVPKLATNPGDRWMQFGQEENELNVVLVEHVLLEIDQTSQHLKLS